jgi:hypothetical protein
MVNLSQNILTTDEQCSIRCVPPAKQSEQFQAETQQEKLLWDNKVIAAIAKKVAAVNTAIEKMQ